MGTFLRQALHWPFVLLLLTDTARSLGSDLSQADRNFLVVKSDIWEDTNFEDTLVHGKGNSQVLNILRLGRPPPRL